MSFDDLLAQGIAEAKAGNKQQARKLLGAAIRAAPEDERGWGWFYTVCENDQERLKCLGEVLRIKPDLEAVRKKHAEISSRVSLENAPKPEHPQPEIKPEPPKEERSPEIQAETPPVPPRVEKAPRKRAKWVGYLLVTILVIGLILLGLYFLQKYTGFSILGGIPALQNASDAMDFVEIVPGWTCNRDSGFMVFNGNVRNSSGQYNLKFVELRATVYQADGSALNTGTGHVDSDILNLDQTSTFHMLVEDPAGEGKKCGLAVENAYFSK
jgi:hypothetical protein